MLPKGIAATGFPRVRETCRRIGIEFDPWQQDLNKCILAKTADGMFAADTIVLSIPRQVGKTWDVGAIVFAECIAVPGTTVVWTAHRFKVSRETFNELRALAKSPKLAPHIDYDAITTAAGNECIPFRNGSRIVFAARERGTIRGFTKVRILVLDEAQILTHAVLSDLVPTMNQAVNPLILLMGTPPKPSDPGEVFSELRAEALAEFREHGHSVSGTLYVELSAKPGSDPDDREAWKEANLSYPKRTPARAILRMRKLLSEDDFLREALGIWDGDGRGVISAEAWRALLDAGSKIQSGHRFALDVSPAQDWAAISVAGTREDGRLHLEVTSRGGVVDHRAGIDWVVPRLTELHKRFPDVPVAIVAGGAAASLSPALTQAGVEVAPITHGEVMAACGLFYGLATAAEPGFVHIGQPDLTAAVAAAARKFTAEKAFMWGRARAGDITPLYSATLALWAAHKAAEANYEVLDSFY